MTKLEALIFDLDGTLLHTLPDLAACANEAMVQMGFPEHSLVEYERLMGYGGRWLIEQSLPKGATAEQRARAFELWRSLYIEGDYPLTMPFPGVADMVCTVRERGLKTGVLSNKFHEGACVLVSRHFPGAFDEVRGDKPPAPRKPDPTTLLEMLNRLGVSPDAAAYVGDANVDLQTARNAGVMAVGVAWGYDHANPLRIGDLDVFIREPSELCNLL